jgi:hypothetical protein
MRNDLPEPALEYSIAAGDVDTVADTITGSLVGARQRTLA